MSLRAAARVAAEATAATAAATAAAEKAHAAAFERQLREVVVAAKQKGDPATLALQPAKKNIADWPPLGSLRDEIVSALEGGEAPALLSAQSATGLKGVGYDASSHKPWRADWTEGQRTMARNFETSLEAAAWVSLNDRHRQRVAQQESSLSPDLSDAAAVEVASMCMCM